MRSLYDILNESILDNDKQVNNSVETAPAQLCIDFLSKSPYWKFCKYEIKGANLFVTRKTKYTEFKEFQFDIQDGQCKLHLIVPKVEETIDISLLDVVHFVDCSITTYTDTLDESLKFLSNCKSCYIHPKNDRANLFNNRELKNLADILKDTSSTVIIDGTVHYDNGNTIYADYSCLNNLDFGNCKIILGNNANMDTIKGLKVDRLLLQTWNYYEDDISKFKFDANDVEDYGLYKFLERNSIKALGIIDNCVQYTNWLNNQRKWILLKSDAKRVPRI